MRRRILLLLALAWLELYPASRGRAAPPPPPLQSSPLPTPLDNVITATATPASAVRAVLGPPEAPRLGPATAPPLPTTAPPLPTTLPAPRTLEGQPAPAGPSPLSVGDLERLALASNPTIAAAEALVRQEAGILRQDTLYPNPTAGYLRTDNDQSGQSSPRGVFLSQDIVTPGKIALARQSGIAGVDWRKWQLEAQRGRVVNDVRIRFYEVLGAQQAVQVSEELERVAAQGVRMVEQLIQGKIAARPDLLQAEIQLNAVRTILQDARYRHQAAWKQLANVVGVPDLPPTVLCGSLEANVPQLDWEESVQKVLAGSPVLQGQQAQIRAAGWDVKLAKIEAVPNLSLQVVAQRDPVMKFSSVSTLIAMPIPLFNRNQGNIQSAVGKLQQQLKEYERVQLALRDQMAFSFQHYQAARNQAERLRKEILPRAKEAVELTTKGYQAGQFDFLRVLNARQTYFETNLAYLDALTALHKVAIEIEGLQLTGGLNPTEVGTALQTMPGMGGGQGPRSVLLQQLQQQGAGGSKLLPGALQGGAR